MYYAIIDKKTNKEVERINADLITYSDMQGIAEAYELKAGNPPISSTPQFIIKQILKN